MKNTDQLIRDLGYDFSDPALLELALTHRSYHKITKSNERLEFLGDSILNFVIARSLYDKFKMANEGELSRLRATIVNRSALATVAKHFHLGEYILLGTGERKSGGHRRESILANTFEAIIGAVFLDAGFDMCEKKILQWFAILLDKACIKKPNKDPKTALQEHLQAEKLELPRYEIIKMEGHAHAKTFQVRCLISCLNLITEGIGHSRQLAEQHAAAEALKRLPK